MKPTNCCNFLRDCNGSRDTNNLKDQVQPDFSPANLEQWLSPLNKATFTQEENQFFGYAIGLN